MSALATPLTARITKFTPMQWFGVLLVITCVLALGLPPDPRALHAMHITSSEFRLAIFSLLIPYVVCWFCGFYVFAKLSEYTPYLKKSVEGAAFSKITKGMGLLAFGLIIPTMATLILGQIAQRHMGYKPTTTVMSNYISLLFPLLALNYISNGSRALANSTKIKSNIHNVKIFAAIFVVLSTLYAFLVSYNYHHYHNPYHLHIFALMITYVAPYLFMWFLGLISAYDFRLYSRNVKGILYKNALRTFANGIGLAICGSIVSQFIAGTLGISEKSLGPVLLVNYIILVIIGSGLVLMAIGANKLKKIEEV
jgi:hypothetical protein